MTAAERDKFLYAVGQQFAYKGSGVFVFYNTVKDAYADAKKFPNYRVLKFDDKFDFNSFARGYIATKAELHWMWKKKADAEAVIKKISGDIDLSAQSYVYDKDKPAPFDYSGNCAVCDKDIVKCTCPTFKGKPNPEYSKWMAGDRN